MRGTNKSLLSALTLGAFGLSSKAFLNHLCADVRVAGLPRFLDELDKLQQRSGKGRGMLTFSNHISSLDDPLVWGLLPASYFLNGRTRRLRWALGASDTCFTNPLLSGVLRQGQVLETFRGQGVRQKVVDRAVELLNEGEWVHIFPEGLIARPPHSNLRRLKWGIGRMLAETEEIPTIVPMWLTGFDEVSVETRPFSRFIPRAGKEVSITFGESDTIERRMEPIRMGRRRLGDADEDEDMWAEITRVVQEELESLGGQVSGVVEEGVVEAKGKRDL